MIKSALSSRLVTFFSRSLNSHKMINCSRSFQVNRNYEIFPTKLDYERPFKILCLKLNLRNLINFKTDLIDLRCCKPTSALAIFTDFRESHLLLMKFTISE